MSLWGRMFVLTSVELFESCVLWKIKLLVLLQLSDLINRCFQNNWWQGNKLPGKSFSKDKLQKPDWMLRAGSRSLWSDSVCGGIWGHVWSPLLYKTDSCLCYCFLIALSKCCVILPFFVWCCRAVVPSVDVWRQSGDSALQSRRTRL